MLWRRAARHPVSVFDTAGFILPLTDLGAGAVNLVLQRGAGVATFTRATVAWTKLASGLWAQIASGTARSCYLGATTAVGAYGGYFAEAAGTQLVTPTASIRDMTDASWVKVTMTTAKTSTGIDGVASSATRLTATGAVSTILQTLVAAASSRTYSCWMRRVTGVGTILIAQGGTTLDVTALINSSTYTRVELNASILNAAIGITINTSGDAIDVDFNQFEAGALATSPMDAAGAVRNEDSLNYPTSGNIVAASGTFYVEYASGHASPNFIISTNNGDTRPININTDTLVGIFKATQGFAVSNAGSSYVGTVRKMATSWGSTKVSACIEGSGAAVSDPVATTVGGTTINLDASGDGFLSNVRIWPTQLSDEQLQGITA